MSINTALDAVNRAAALRRSAAAKAPTDLSSIADGAPAALASVYASNNQTLGLPAIDITSLLESNLPQAPTPPAATRADGTAPVTAPAAAVPFSPVKAAGVVATAHQYLGVPYKWGGNDPKVGIDCSAFVQQVMARNGIQIPRTTYDQVKVGAPVTLNDLQPGDAVFTRPGKDGPDHVGLYIGNGMIQESPHTGDVNKVIGLKDFLTGGFVAARRYTPGS